MPVSRETEARLRLYQDLLLKWQKRINLVSPSSVETAWGRHFEDSVQLLPYLPEGPASLYDLGSGAGFPGLVLAICRPDLAVTLIESDSKKCAFLNAVSRETGAAVVIENSRIEIAAARLSAPHVVTARALAALTELLAYVAPWAGKNPDLRLVLPKGASFEQEIAAARQAGWQFELEVFPSRTEPSARILLVSGIGLSPR